MTLDIEHLVPNQHATSDPSGYSSSLVHPFLISFLAFSRSSRCCRRSFLLMVLCIFSHICRAFFPSSVSTTDRASILNVMSRFPRSRCGLVWSTGHASTVCSSPACGLYLARLLRSPVCTVNILPTQRAQKGIL